MGAGGERHLLGAESMDSVETLAAALEQNADQIDQHLGAARRSFHGWRMAEIGLHRVDLADTTERLQMIGEIGPPHRHPDQVVPLGERPHHMAAKKARAAINRDQSVKGAACGHTALDSVPAEVPLKPANSGSAKTCIGLLAPELTSRKRLRT